MYFYLISSDNNRGRMVSNSIILAFFLVLSVVNKIRFIILSNLIVELLPEYILVHSGLGAGLTTTGKHAAKGYNNGDRSSSEHKLPQLVCRIGFGIPLPNGILSQPAQ